MKLPMWRWLLGGAALVVAISLGLSGTLFTVGPGQLAVLEKDGKPVGVPLSAGTHWKIPLVEGVVRMHAGTQLATGKVTVGSGNDAIGVHYAVLWRISDPRRFVAATAGSGEVVADRLKASLTPALQHLIGSEGPDKFLRRSATDVEIALTPMTAPPAKKLGIDILGVELGRTDLPASLRATVSHRMALAVGTQASAAASSGGAAQAAQARLLQQRRAQILANADREAASLRGQADARVAGIYAQAARKSPRFFRFYQSLINEEKALAANTRLLVISTDSSWFRVLRSTPPGGRKH